MQVDRVGVLEGEAEKQDEQDASEDGGNESSSH
jgi:hypothetical protein